MFWSIVLFELRKRLRWPSTYVYFGLLFALAFLTMIVAGGTFNSVRMSFGSGGKVLANAPYAINVNITLMGVFGIPIIAALTGQAIHQDFESNSYALFFTSPIKRLPYLVGRFIGAQLVLLFIFSGVALGQWLGSEMWFLDAAMVGKNVFAAYLAPYLTSVLPNLLFLGAIFFTVATLSRKMFPVYVLSVVLLVGYLIALNLASDVENKTLAGLVDPFGLNALDTVTQYWTVAERNARVVSLTGVYLWNRLLWLGVGALFFGLTLARFRFEHVSGAEGARAGAEPEEAASAAPIPTGKVEPAPPLALVPGMTWLLFRETVKNVYFVVMVLAGVLFMVAAAQNLNSMFGTSTYPVTYAVLGLTSGSFMLFNLIIITFYAGDLVWRERDAKVDQLYDALPVPTWVPFVSKLLALMLVQVLLTAVVMACGLAIQAFKHYFHFELGLYVQDLFGLKLWRLFFLCVLALTVHSIVQHKYVGHFIMVLYYVINAVMAGMGFEHNLYRFGGSPPVVYSDMNGYGHFLKPVAFFDLYWACVSVLLAVAARLVWARGVELTPKARLAGAGAQFSRRLRLLAAAALVGAAGLGAFIFYNTNVLNTYRTSSDRDDLQAEYEKLYKPLEKLPQPRVTDVKLAVDIFPYERDIRMKGTLALANKTTQPIQTVVLNVPEKALIHRLVVASEDKPAKEDRKHQILTYELKQPLAPGATSAIELDIEYKMEGFENTSSMDQLVYNGTFIDTTFLPAIGYDPHGELTEDNDRRKHGLPPKERMADVNDLAARQSNYLGATADWVSYEATVSTSPDQIALTSGYLQREWTENGRRYFHYKSEGKLLDFFSFLSARYAVKRDKWNDVNIEIYYQPGHEYNVDRMIEATKASLEYCSKNFGPYQHRQVRILEFPRYRTFAQSFANTIPFSESIGFIAKVDPNSEEDIDYPYYVTAHEVAHQWWAHQVIGGNVQGATVMSETLAQYSSLMVMKQKYGQDRMKRFLRYELERYLIGRGVERKKELPLARVENQPYIHYRKGSLVMYALQDYIGEDKVDQALARFLKDKAYQGPPYPNTTEFLPYLRAVTPKELQYVIDDMFENITLYENRAVSATASPKGNGQYEVKLSVAAKKLRADGLGKEQTVPIDDLVDIGVLDEKGKVLFLEKRRIHSEKGEFSVLVNQKPAKAGIDPLNKLIDRQPEDNVTAVTTN